MSGRESRQGRTSGLTNAVQSLLAGGLGGLGLGELFRRGDALGEQLLGLGGLLGRGSDWRDRHWSRGGSAGLGLGPGLRRTLLDLGLGLGFLRLRVLGDEGKRTQHQREQRETE